MKRILLVSLLLSSTFVHAQLTFEDSIILETRQLVTLDEMNISSLLIIDHFTDDSYPVMKGFLFENNIDCARISATTFQSLCESRSKIRGTISSNNDSTFTITYNYSSALPLLSSTCYLFNYENSLIAIPTEIYTKDQLRSSVFYWYLGPSSSDEREVVVWCWDEGKIWLVE